MAQNTTPVSEENIPQVGLHRATGTRYGFWLETSEDGSSAALVNPSAPAGDVNFITLPIVQDYTVSEPVAVTITPTQGGGKFVEDRGMIIKDITISGTSGYTPLPDGQSSRRGGITGRANGNKLPQLTDEEAHARSGYKAFIELRNLFRRYEFIKRYGTPRQQDKTRMHFMDAKLGDFWVIQPQNFTLRRSVGGRTRMTFDYSIRVTTLSPSVVLDDLLLPESKELLENGLSVIGTTQAATGSASTSLGVLGAQTQRTSLTDRLRQLQSDIRDKTQSLNISALQKVNEFLSVTDAFVALFALPALATRDLVSLGVGVLARVENSIEGLLGVYELTADTFNPNSRFWNETYLEARSIYEAIRSRATVLFGESATERLLRENQKWEQPRGISDTQLAGGSAQRAPFLQGGGLANTRAGSMSDPISLRPFRVQRGDSIFSISQRALGTVQKYPDIIAINGLIPPFVIDDVSGVNRKAGVLYPGDLVYVPASNTQSADALAAEIRDYLVRDKQQGTLTDVNGLVLSDNTQSWVPNQWVGYVVAIGNDSRVVTASDEISITINRLFAVTPIPGNAYTLSLQQFSSSSRIPTADELTYGRDILCSFDFGQGMEKSVSTALNAANDLATVSGLDNYVQALRLLMITEQGRHIFHTLYGNPMPIGQRMLLSTIQFYQMLVSRSIVSDPRTDKVLRVDIAVTSGQPDVLNSTIEVVPIGNTRAEKVGLAS